MAQINIPATNTPTSLVAANTAIIPSDDLAEHPLTIVTTGAATITITDNGDGWHIIGTSATVTVARP